MKILCYGASVTAQKNETGYFQHLENSPCKNHFSSIERVAFGASQYEYAGYAFMQDVIEARPNICIIDWLTPSMPAFNAFKIDLLNRALLEINCLPIWVYFPRTNSYDVVPEAYKQVKKSSNDFSLDFIDLRESMPGFMNDPSKYLRDAVHTNLEGAICYANKISEVVNNVMPKLDEYLDRAKNSDGFLNSRLKKYSTPIVSDTYLKIDSYSGIEIDVVHEGGLFELFFETEVGPHMCLLDFEIYVDGRIFHKETINSVDPWCYYERGMVIETIRRRIPENNYKIIVKKAIGNPFLDKAIRKPIEDTIPNEDRFLEIRRISASAKEFRVSPNKIESSMFLDSAINFTSISRYKNVYENVYVDTKTSAVLDGNLKPIYETLYEIVFWWKGTLNGKNLTDPELRVIEVERRFRDILSEIETITDDDIQGAISLQADDEAIYAMSAHGWYPYGHLHDSLLRLFPWRNTVFKRPKVLCSKYNRVVDFPLHLKACGFEEDTIFRTAPKYRLIKVPKLFFGVNEAKFWTTMTQAQYEWLIEGYFSLFEQDPRTLQPIEGLYLSRNHVGRRGVINNDEVQDFLVREKGFLTLTGEEGLLDIISLFSRAKIIVGPHGSIFVNTIFCQKHAKIIEFCPRNRIDKSFLNKTKVADNYLHILKDADDDYNITIDIDELSALLT